jgi:hypothetical protein
MTATLQELAELHDLVVVDAVGLVVAVAGEVFLASQRRMVPEGIPVIWAASSIQPLLLMRGQGVAG